MKKMLTRAYGATKSAARKIATGTGIAVAGIGSAMAQSSLGTAAASAVDDVQSDVNGVLAVLVVVVFILVAWAYLKKAK